MNKTILVADDYAGSVSMLQEFLRERGYATFAAADGEEAIQKAAALLPDLIILDIMMPKVDGTEVARALKENRATKDIPVIFLTALVTKDDALEIVPGAQMVCAKPVNYEELLGMIRKSIG